MIKKELLLRINKFNQPDDVENIEALLRLFYNLLVLEPGTYPDNPTMGIGIQNYLFETTESAVYKLTTEINKQVYEFLPEMNIINVRLGETNNKYVLALVMDFKYDNKEYSLLVNTNNDKETTFSLDELRKK